MPDFIYLDNGATTPPDPEILQGMCLQAQAQFGNPTSTHSMGRAALASLDESRARIAAVIDARSEEVIFTSGGTESVGLAILGLSGRSPGRIAYSAVEHSCVGQAAQWLKLHRGWAVDKLPVDADGRLTAEHVQQHLKADCRLVCVMMANNEIGTINDIEVLSRMIRSIAPRAKIVVDAVQAFAKMPISVAQLGVDALAVNGHKIHGPKGIGALWCRHALQPVFRGGGQEFGQRGGTPSPALAWSLAEAARRQQIDNLRIRNLRDALFERLSIRLPTISVTGPSLDGPRLGNNLHICIPGLPTEPLLNALSAEGIYASGGSACRSGQFSPVLQAIGCASEDGAYLRLTVGRFTTEGDLESASERIASIVTALRPVYTP
ncbi:MAG: cysteine desulfurase family protein [Myxococcota bacterium]|nr:cysteine desulfurase family protein [Myxococcota bacterium]